jgi:hypothetical protein
LAAIGLGVGVYQHVRNKARQSSKLLRENTDHGFEDDDEDEL